MPRSKRNKVITLSKTTKKPGRENNEKLFGQVRDCVDQYQHIFVFNVENMRNTYLKDVRNDLDDSRYVSKSARSLPRQLIILTVLSRLFFGKTKVMAKALGLSREDEYRDGLHILSKVCITALCRCFHLPSPHRRN